MSNSADEQIENTEETPNNAIDFIKSSGFYSDQKYSWVTPLIDKVLTDESVDAEVETLLSVGDTDTDNQTQTIIVSKPMTYSVEPRDIRSINEITSISNVGLVNVTQPLKFESGLNIFYGKNGAGKSSIYNALCSIFGKDKKVNPNLDTQEDSTFCVIKYTNQAGSETDLRWDMGTENPNSPTMIFDGQIAQTLVDNDQDNKFEIAHLKLEYFSYLHNLYEKIDKVLDSNSTMISSKIQTVEQSYGDTLGFIFNTTLEELVSLSAMTISNAEELRLKEVEGTLLTLSKENPEAVVKNLSSIKEKIIDVLQSFGSKNVESNEWQIKHTKEKTEKLNERIKAFCETRKLLAEGGINKLSKLIPSEWVQNPVWLGFIAKSIEFAENLDEESKHKYANDNCIYCQQKLATDDSKELVNAYHEITAEHKTKLEEEKVSLEGIANIVENVYIAKLGKLTETNTSITLELDTVQATILEKVDSNTITAIYTKIKDSVSNFNTINVTESEFDELNSFYSTYAELEKNISEKIANLSSAITSRGATVKSLTEEAIPLRQKSLIKQHNSVILDYLDSKKRMKDIEDKSSNISSLKQATSTQETSFAKIASLKEFKGCLDKEYEHFNFTPPSFWNLKPVTKDGVNKRNYSLADKRLVDIFSEGERKLHALADFFAQCEVNKYKGVYIFDDPVNSLDEENIVKVAKRIVRLADSGNQVIVFTHNLYFLNALDKDSRKSIYKVSKIKSSNNVLIEGTKIDTDSLLKTKLGAINEQMKLLEDVEAPEVIQIGVVYDLMSGYIEEYVEKKLLSNVVSRYRANIRMTSLPALSAISEEKIKLITDLYENASRGGNRHDNPDDASEPTYLQLKIDVEALIKELNYT